MNKNLTRSGVAVICACMVAATAFGSNQRATRTQVLEEMERFLARYLGPATP